MALHELLLQQMDKELSIPVMPCMFYLCPLIADSTKLSEHFIGNAHTGSHSVSVNFFFIP